MLAYMVEDCAGSTLNEICTTDMQLLCFRALLCSLPLQDHLGPSRMLCGLENSISLDRIQAVKEALGVFTIMPEGKGHCCEASANFSIHPQAF